MSTPRSIKKEEFKDVIALINKIFRISRGYKPTMQEEFPLLLNENNIDNMVAIFEEGKPVSDINYLEQKLFIEGASVKIAAIGAVSTDEKYRQRGYASEILNHIEHKMYKEQVDVLLISGTRSLYSRRDCIRTKNFYEYTINPKEVSLSFQVKEYSEEYLHYMLEMYNENSTRYCRTYEGFKSLLHAATIPWGSFTYKKYVLLNGDEFIGYIVLRIIGEESKEGKVRKEDEDRKEDKNQKTYKPGEEDKYGEVVEAYTCSDCLYSSLSKLAQDLKLKYIKHYVNIKNRQNYLCNYDNRVVCFQEGTVKIINFNSFMEHLKPYFKYYVHEDLLDKVTFLQNEGGYFINVGEESLNVKTAGEITKLVFEGITSVKDLESSPKLKEFLSSAFPIPFVWTANLNYQ